MYWPIRPKQISWTPLKKITAAVTDSRSVSAVKIYIDGVSKYQTTSKQVDTSLSMSAGSHRITVKAWDSVGSFSQTENITVH